MSAGPLVGTEFAGYRVEAVIGRGGMSAVYRAQHPRLGSSVALKVLAPQLSEHEGFRERFVRESRLAASISHPNVIPIHDAGQRSIQASIGSSSPRAPRSASCRTAAAVNCLLTEAIWNRVAAVFGVDSSASPSLYWTATVSPRMTSTEPRIRMWRY